MLKKTLIILITIAIILLLAYKYVYQNHRNISEEKPEFQITTTQILDEFLKDEPKATQKYLDKTLAIEGVVTNVIDSIITLDEHINCSLKNVEDMPTLNQKATIKGRCIGYDEIVEELKLDECSLIKP